jgi:hypothetical protein
MSWQQQLGNMASTLARVSNNATISEHDEVVVMCYPTGEEKSL